MIKENSPICAMLIPACTAVRIPVPPTKAPKETVMTLATITRTVNAAIAPQCWKATAGSISIPTDTKKIARKTSRSGSIRCSTSSLCPDSATSDPANEGAKGNRVAGLLSEIRRGEAEADARHQRGLLAPQAHDETDEARDEQNSNGEECGQKGGQPPDGREKRARGKARTGRDRRQGGEEHDGDQVLQQQHADHQLP